MKTVVVGDLHGKYNIVEEILTWDYNVVFVGDYLDSFTHKAVEQLHTLDLILDSVIKSNGRVKALLGNHEIAYLNPRMACSGNSTAVQIGILHRDMSPLLTHLWLHDDILITHAGVSQHLLTSSKLSLTEYLDAGDFNQIGYSRGGRNTIGGLYWCDWWEEFVPVAGTRQIVGHTAFRPVNADKGIVTNDDNYNIDCLDKIPQVLVIDEEGEISYETLEDIDGY